MTDDRPDTRWLLLIYRVAQDPPGRRTYVWRQLKLLGAVYLQQAAAVLPDRPEVRTALEALAERIRAQAGEVSLLETTSPSLEWERELIQRFNTARDEEYAEIAENVERFEDEIRRETRKAKFTFAELEDIESDWEKIGRWHDRVLVRGKVGLEVFATAVYAHEGVHEETSHGNRAADASG